MCHIIVIHTCGSSWAALRSSLRLRLRPLGLFFLYFAVWPYPCSGARNAFSFAVERAASTSRTKPHTDNNTINQRAKLACTKSLHQCLHQIGGLIESYGPKPLADALVESLGKDACDRLAAALVQLAMRD